MRPNDVHGPTRLGYVTPQSVGEALRVLLIRAGLTVETLAVRAQISRTSASAHLSGERRMNLDVLGKLVAVLAHELGYDATLLGSELLEVASREQATETFTDAAPDWASEELGKAVALLAIDATWDVGDLLRLTLSREKLLQAGRPYLRELEVMRDHFGLEMDVENDDEGLTFTLRPAQPDVPHEERT